MNSLHNNVTFHKGNLSPAERDDFNDYTDKFIQRNYSYAVKSPKDKKFHPTRKPLSDPPIFSHLNGDSLIGVLAQHYPKFFSIHIQGRPIEFVIDIMESRKLNDRNSILLDGEDHDSFDILGSPVYNGKPPTSKLLYDASRPFAKKYNVTVYPSKNTYSLAQFSPHCEIFYPFNHNSDSLHDKLHLFDTIDDYDISRFPGNQYSLDFYTPKCLEIPVFLQDGDELYKHGLMRPGTRLESQCLLLAYLYRCNISLYKAKQITWRWINENHNGFDRDIFRYPQQVKKEIEVQANYIYSFYDDSNTLPDSTCNLYNGYIAACDVRKIFKMTVGSFPRSNLFFYILKYSYPRRYRNFIGIHSDKLIEWCSWETYLKYLDEFERKGFLKRGKVYSDGNFSKDIKLNWDYKSSNEAVLLDGRAIYTLEDTVRFLYTPREFRQLLISSGCKRTTAIETVKRIFG